MYIVLCLKGVGLISYPFFLLFKKVFVYLHMEQYDKIAELYGKVLELQHENEQLKQQLVLNLRQ